LGLGPLTGLQDAKDSRRMEHLPRGQGELSGRERSQYQVGSYAEVEQEKGRKRMGATKRGWEKYRLGKDSLKVSPGYAEKIRKLN